MKKAMKKFLMASFGTLSALTTASPSLRLHAGSEYVGIQGAQIAMGDAAGRLTFTRTLNLPTPSTIPLLLLPMRLCYR